MGLFSFFRRDASARTGATAGADAAGPTQLLRVRARRRLIGAAVLVVIGVIGFPLVFETQPRPIPVDLAIEIPRKDTAPALKVPLQNASAPGVAASAQAATDPGKARVAANAEAVPAPAPALAPAPAPTPARDASDKPAAKAAAPTASAVAPNSEALRAQALLEDRAIKVPTNAPASAASVGPAGQRFVVQIGAYAEAKAAQEVRARVEKLGLKTYTQAVETADGKRTRVRLGPFASRDEALQAAAQLRAAGLPGDVLTL